MRRRMEAVPAMAKSALAKMGVAISAIFLCMCVLSAGAGKMAVLAESDEGAFSGNVALLKKENGNYVMQVTVENQGEDFSGTVQALFASTGVGNCAYNTEIALPAQGKKQFTITITDRAAETVRGMCVLNFLDKKGNLLQSIPLNNVFGNSAAGISVGILSDNYSGLTFMDAGGRDFTIRGAGSAPLYLLELNNDNIEGCLEGLHFLIIDQFNVSSLSEGNILAIQEWVKNGGWLLIGTGAYAEQTLSGFEEDFLGVQVDSVSEPGEGNVLALNAGSHVYYNYAEAGVDFRQMAVASLDYNNTLSQQSPVFYENGENPAICGPVGDGAAAIYFISLGEKELQKLESYMIERMYSELMVQSNSYMQYGGYYGIDYLGERALAFIDKRNTDVDFTLLGVLIGIYVVLVGPVIYLILRKCKKSEWYWVCAPVLGLCFIGGVFLFGQGARVKETKVYSVTVQQAGSNQADTYFLAYRSGVKPWEVQLNDSYEVAGPGGYGYGYSYRSSINPTDYYYSISNNSQGVSIGVKPRENFESAYLYAGRKADKKGTISGTDMRTDIKGSISGMVTNETVCDLAYMAVWCNPYIMVISDVKAGETIDLQQAVRDGRCVYENTASYSDSLLYSMVSIYSYRNDYEQDDMAALVIGIGIAEDAMPTDAGQYAVVAGVVKNYEKAVVDESNEISYGCLYSYVEMEVGQDAAD